ncbi:MAG: phenylalanine--tRNA ligase subunit beta [Flavisolibacter sp.]
MTISYNWLSEYLPVKVDPERLSRILTSVGLEVEKMETFDEVKGGLKDLWIGEVIDVQQHPNADKLKLTKVKVGDELLQIVCGAPNVAAGQKVVVAKVGTTIYPVNHEPITMKVAKIRGEESYGMICAEDEIGVGTSHDGIMVLPADVVSGTPAVEYFKPYSDVIYEIGLTPNRMDAMSHWGVARDVCAYLSHHDKIHARPKLLTTNFKVDASELEITVTIENTEACRRYSGVCISGVTVQESPTWLQQKLKAIGVRPINNIVDITNFILHETGQPLHAFDYDKIGGQTVIVKTPDAGSRFTTLDEKERKLDEEDLMICDAREPMCIAGVFGGVHSGVSEGTKNIFLESAFFDAVSIRKTSFRHGLRTDAAMRFEKGTDISATVNVLKRAAMLMAELAGGRIASEIVDVYPEPKEKTEIALRYQYLKKLSGKIYHPDSVTSILQSLDFVIVREGLDAMAMQVPYHKPDVTQPADVVEEILRIDGLDNIEIPTAITITPSVEQNDESEQLKEKLSNLLAGLGFSEIITNSLTNSDYFKDETSEHLVRLLNNLSTELDVMRPTMLPTALEVLAHNINRKNLSLKFFEFGKTYRREKNAFVEDDHLSLYITGAVQGSHWKKKAAPADIFYAKGIAEALLSAAGVNAGGLSAADVDDYDDAAALTINRSQVVTIGAVSRKWLNRFDIRQPVYVVDFNWNLLLKYGSRSVRFREIPRFPSVERDLALVVSKDMKYEAVEQQVQKLKLPALKQMKVFDVFESEKLGKDKKSMAVNFVFQDEEKTLTDKEIDKWMEKIMNGLEKELQAEIRR